MTAGKAADFADQAVAALSNASQAGWRPVGSELQEGDFDAVRDPPKFRELVAGLWAKAEAANGANAEAPSPPPDPDR